MTSMIPYRSLFSTRPTLRPVIPASLFDAFDDMLDLSSDVATKAFPIDVEDKGESYEVKAYLTGVSKDNIDVELNEGRLSISVEVEGSKEEQEKNYLQREFTAYSATRGVYLKDASSEGLSAGYVDGVLTVTIPKIVEKQNVTKIAID
ncbi:Hsp20 family protein [Collinsella sp. AGMB00827]|uniref:Hsp20 family protein n=1 Tax=Collinsella ureilytica TaxID=2869515 RepID=A0ABS7MKJ4_9ACTN|nr:Hsp20 family protein [Collinsella urealyticum]MBY4797833.1 Hsp20 family protein [Collinsella urealyticum]